MDMEKRIGFIRCGAAPSHQRGPMAMKLKPKL